LLGNTFSFYLKAVNTRVFFITHRKSSEAEKPDSAGPTLSVDLSRMCIRPKTANFGSYRSSEEATGMSISAEKLNYLKGITDGMNLSEATSEGKLFLGIIDVLSALSSEKEQLESRVDKLGDYLDDLDRSFSELCDMIDDESADQTEAEADSSKEDDGHKAGKTQYKNPYEDDEFDDSEDGVSYYSVVCPYCESYVTLTGDLLPEKGEGFECPACGKLLFRK